MSGDYPYSHNDLTVVRSEFGIVSLHPPFELFPHLVALRFGKPVAYADIQGNMRVRRLPFSNDPKRRKDVVRPADRIEELVEVPEITPRPEPHFLGQLNPADFECVLVPAY